MTDNEGVPVEHELVMPLKVCVTQGGPYEDQAFVAGYIAGVVDQEMRVGMVLDRTVPTGVVPQLELLAMHYGYKMTAKPYDEYPEWSDARFYKVSNAVSSSAQAAIDHWSDNKDASEYQPDDEEENT